MQALEKQNVLEALAAHHANITVVARDAARLAELRDRCATWYRPTSCAELRRHGEIRLAF